MIIATQFHKKIFNVLKNGLRVTFGFIDTDTVVSYASIITETQLRSNSWEPKETYVMFLY